MPERSSNSAEVKVFKIDRDSVIKKVKDYAASLVADGLAKTIILFGSFARGDYGPFSDVDLLIIVEKTEKKPAERILPYLNPSLPFDVEPRVLTEQEFLEMARNKRMFVKEILENGVFLVGDEKILEKARSFFHLKNV